MLCNLLNYCECVILNAFCIQDVGRAEEDTTVLCGIVQFLRLRISQRRFLVQDKSVLAEYTLR